eukprot:TRINITY_DN66503_c0_g1_i1.p1 TRINITY_DN66503_c0_g1~~TRINITY_DN66503_c0_g1_i1.p1  ORF type:complete len:423 (+),score=138.79 TRINITY_DN66503_c0_g1_i1:184-1269(+)
MLPRLSATQWEAAASVASYSSCSIGMVILNKLVVDRSGFNYPSAIVFFQALSALVLVTGLHRVGLIEFPQLERTIVVRWIPLTALFIGMLATSLLGLRTMSVSVNLLIKNLALILIAAGDWFLFDHYVDRWVVLSFVLMILGSALGARTDPWVTPEGLVWSFANVACTTGYQLYMKGMMNDLRKRLGQWGPVFYNNLLALPPMIIPTLLSASGDRGWIAGMASMGVVPRVYLGIMMCVGAVMTMASFWCMRMTSPTTYSVVGSLNKVPLALIGMYVFDQFPTSVGAMGIVSALCGGMLYTAASARGKARERRLQQQVQQHEGAGETPLTPPGEGSGGAPWSDEGAEQRHPAARGHGSVQRL